MKFGNATSIDQLPDDFQAPSIGTSETVAATLHRMFPTADHYQGMLSLHGQDFWVELAYDCHTDSDGMVSAVGVRSNGGSGALEPIGRICHELEARLYDCQMGELVEMEEGAAQSMKTYTEWRDRCLFASQGKTSRTNNPINRSGGSGVAQD